MIKNETGSVFGRLTVKCQLPSEKQKAMWLCRCSCGGACITSGDALRAGKVKSCGCYRASGDFVRSHGHGSAKKGVSRTYKSWQEMRARCANPNHVSYRNYGGRGIAVAPEWESFGTFLKDMGERPPGTSLDRRDGSLGYSKRNCLWSTRTVQNNNRRNVRLISYLGRQQSLAQWCRELNLPYSRMYNRLRVQNLVFEKAVNI
jgi:hypothetical protein